MVVKVQYSAAAGKVTGTALEVSCLSERRTTAKHFSKKETLMATGWRVVIQSEENSKEDTVLVLSTLCVSVLTSSTCTTTKLFMLCTIISRPHCSNEFPIAGKTCEIDVNECISNPCQNNATCVDDVNGYICECLPGFKGKQERKFNLYILVTDI